jgi:hypothetical protein
VIVVEAGVSSDVVALYTVTDCELSQLYPKDWTDDAESAVEYP